MQLYIPTEFGRSLTFNWNMSFWSFQDIRLIETDSMYSEREKMRNYSCLDRFTREIP